MFQNGPDSRRNKCGDMCRDREMEAGNRDKGGRRHTMKIQEAELRSRVARSDAGTMALTPSCE